MRSSMYGKWTRSRKVQAYVVIPSICSLVMMLMYFSGSSLLQNIIAPFVYGTDPKIWTKVGLLELSQVFLLLCILFFAIRCLLISKNIVSRVLVLALIAMTVFVLLQETGYGNFYTQYFDRPPMPARMDPSNPLTFGPPPEAELVASQLNTGFALLMAAILLISPVLSNGRNRILRLIVPGPMMSLGSLVAVSWYFLAVHLENGGHSIIEGQYGHLHYDIVEFLQFSLYYLMLVYTATLHERIFFSK